MRPSQNVTSLSEQEAVNLVLARLFDYFGRRTDWQRRLWNPGTVTVLQETLEAVDLFESGHLRAAAVEDLLATASRRAYSDLGVGAPAVRSALEAALSALRKKPADAVSRYQLEQLLAGIEADYLARWSLVLADGAESLAPESASRFLAGHLLGVGFSPDYLHRWTTWLATNRPPDSLASLFSEADGVARRPAHAWQVLVPFTALERRRQRMPAEWLGPAEVTAWMAENTPKVPVRHNGGFLMMVEARDSWSAVEEAGDLLESLAARVAVGVPGSPRFEPHSEALVSGMSDRFPLRRPRRQVDVHALERQDALFSVSESALGGRLRSAIDLVASLESGTPGAAVAGGWAAIEAMLARPNTSSVQAAADLAALVACSFPRAELTPLTYAYSADNDDDLARSLADASSNLERCAILAAALSQDPSLEFERRSDQAAAARVRDIVSEPKKVLGRVATYVEEALRRLYRQRNMVLHAGKTDSVAMPAVLRTAPPLVGAGLDRLVHDALAKGQSDPLHLVARARSALHMCGKAGGPETWDLLGH